MTSIHVWLEDGLCNVCFAQQDLTVSPLSLNCSLVCLPSRQGTAWSSSSLQMNHLFIIKLFMFYWIKWMMKISPQSAASSGCLGYSDLLVPVGSGVPPALFARCSSIPDWLYEFKLFVHSWNCLHLQAYFLCLLVVWWCKRRIFTEETRGPFKPLCSSLWVVQGERGNLHFTHF